MNDNSTVRGNGRILLFSLFFLFRLIREIEGVWIEIVSV